MRLRRILYSLKFKAETISLSFLFYPNNYNMEYTQLGKTDLRVSEIGFGAWAISGEGYGPVDENESIHALNSALERGINFIDTADSYGKGKSEEIIGKVLSEKKDNKTLVATKFGWDFYGEEGVKGNLSSEYINFAVDKSLKRLKREWIDVYQIHSQKPQKIIDFEVIETLKNLKKKGKIRYFGFSANYINDAINLMKLCSFDTLQIPYNLVFPMAEKQLFKNKDIDSLGIISREPLANGFLSGKYKVDSEFHKKDHRNGFNKEKKKQILDKVEELRFLENNNRSLSQAAISFCLQNKHIDVTIPGIKNTKQLEENLLSTDSPLTFDELYQIETIQSGWI